MPFELLTPTAATLKSVTPRTEHHGDDLIVAISMRMEITGANTLLDLLSPKLRHALYTAAEDQEQLPGVEPSTPLLRFNAFDSHTLKGGFEGWALKVDHGIDESDPITLGGAKVDAFRLEAMQGGTIKLAFRVGSNDVSSEEIGLLCGKLGSEISITLHAPEKQPDAIDASSSATDLPLDATGLFADEHGDGPDEDDADDEGGLDGEALRGDTSEPLGDGSALSEAPPEDPGVYSRSRARTARGRDRTKAALAAGAKTNGAAQ